MLLRPLLRAVWFGLAALAAVSAAAADFDPGPEYALLERLLRGRAAQFELHSMASAGASERFRISSANERIKIEGTTPSALLFGVNWYLKYVAHVSISSNGSRLGAGSWPLPAGVIERDTPYALRYAL